ncbi:MAG: type II secretion system protein GspM [Desulfobacterales bacterium]
MNRERKYILLVGMAVLLTGAAYRFFPEDGILFSGREEIALKEKKLARYRETVQEKENLEAGLRKLQAELNLLESGLLSGGTPALAAVEIQNLVNEIAAKGEAEIQSMQILPSKPAKDSSYIPVPVQVTLSGSIRQLKEILYNIENSPKILKISSIRIRPQHRRQSDGVQSEFTVEGFMKENTVKG